MPTYKISQLTTATAVSATNQFEINQNGTSKSVEVSVIDAYIKSTSNLPVVVSVSSATDAVRITQTGTGNALVVEDAANPDATPFVVNASGNVGIGTSSPGTTRLYISSNRATDPTLQVWDTFNGATFENSALLSYDGTKTFFYNFQANPLAFGTNNAERMRIDASGNVGIGTSSPGNKLDIVSAGSSQIRVKDGVNATAYYDFGRDGTDGFFGFSGAQTTFSGYKWSINAGTEVMRITNGGNVGIGTSSPGAKLDVNGVIRSTGTSAILTVSKRSTGTGDAWGFYSQSGELNLYDYTAAASRMVIDASGNVGIGTSSPQSKLSVSNGGAAGLEFYANYPGGGVGTYIQSYNRSTSAYVNTAYEAAQHAFFTSGSERARITSGGDFFVNATALPAGTHGVAGTIYTQGFYSNYGIGSHSGIGGAYQANAINFQWNGSAVRLWVDTTDLGSITVSSDYRVKKDIKTQAATALDRVLQIRPVTYTYADYAPFSWKADGVSREGFIAHELAEIIPSAVEGAKDEQNKVQSLKLDALCSVLVKAIQELKADLDAYKAAHP